MKSLRIQGTARQIGRQLGEFGREAWHQKVVVTGLWQRIVPLIGSPQAMELAAATRARFPEVMAELEGMAEGLQADPLAVFAWNCRGDLLPSTSDGCTTLFGRDAQGRIIVAHNEDGLPPLRDDCALVRVEPTEGPGFISFAYPGSLCGHTFAVNDAGLVNTVNNIRASHRPLGLPRQILGRASLNARDLNGALAILTGEARAGAFHHTLAQAGSPLLYSVEACGDSCSVEEVVNVGGHANHLVHGAQGRVAQRITDSSAARQRRVNDWLAASPEKTLSEQQALALLSDTANPTLPVWRQAPDDPDEENTLATAIFCLSDEGVSWNIWESDRAIPSLSGRVALVEHN
jgi:hypothetical protein